ncbi:MAG: TauD/TfdA family dioxygenase [Acidimicrobiaceae bacterium]|nr:TauD/TfdA family dioxygenase [Acidimicrobiaceae bacterium]
MASIAVAPAASTIGAEVSGVDLSADIDDDLAAEIRAALDDRGVLVFVGQDSVDDEAQKRIASVWAAPRPHPIVEFLGSDEVIGVVYNDADHPPAEGGDSKFHTDYSFNPEIPDVAVLRAVVIPPVGGATVWSDARAALASLDDELVDELRGRVAHHDMGPRFGVEMEARFGAELAARIEARFGAGYRHPIVAVHPRTGDELLFVNAGFTRYVLGLPRARSDALLSRLLEAFVDPAMSFSRRWRPGDVAVWDEHRTVHRGPNDFAPHARKLHRCTAGSRRPAASTKTA